MHTHIRTVMYLCMRVCAHADTHNVLFAISQLGTLCSRSPNTANCMSNLKASSRMLWLKHHGCFLAQKSADAQNSKPQEDQTSVSVFALASFSW